MKTGLYRSNRYNKYYTEVHAREPILHLLLYLQKEHIMDSQTKNQQQQNPLSAQGSINLSNTSTRRKQHQLPPLGM